MHAVLQEVHGGHQRNVVAQDLEAQRHAQGPVAEEQLRWGAVGFKNACVNQRRSWPPPVGHERGGFGAGRRLARFPR